MGEGGGFQSKESKKGGRGGETLGRLRRTFGLGETYLKKKKKKQEGEGDEI